MAGSEASIIIKGLSKRYGKSDKLALDNLSISVNSGEVYGFLGPNGAGKSTAIKLLMNFIQPTSGSGTILGKDIVRGSIDIRKSVGYLAGDGEMYPKMTGRQYLKYMSEIQPAKSQAYVGELEKRFKAQLDKKLGELSRGNRQKINIIQAFMHQPNILILDEPTSGLDPLMQEEFYQLIKEAKSRGATVFASSHILSEVQKMCDRVGIIRDGKLVTERNISEMASEVAQTFDITFAGKVPVSELKKITGAKITNHSGQNATIHVHGKLSPVFSILAKYDVVKIDARNLDLEEVFLRFYQEKGVKK